MGQHLQQMWARLDLGNRNTEAEGIAQALYHGMKANCRPPATGRFWQRPTELAKAFQVAGALAIPVNQ
ncbi:hypothetical protein [Polaromonas sp. YR568]|uniref:hypothetical protein n=1 Tax=Polaromonas sp. YR568 TaxID=1855301 RepID=UPI00398BC3C4